MSNNKFMLKEIYQFNKLIECVSGLTIGDSGNSLNIGGIDKEVIKNPISKLPYIPGSSIKGKMRFMLEKTRNDDIIKFINKKDNKKKYIENLNSGNSCNCGNDKCKICTLFGAYQNTNSHAGPVRIIVRDAVLSKEDEKKFKAAIAADGSYLELKTENSINRNTGTVNTSGARTIERVPEGTKFHLEIILQIYSEDKDKVEEYKKYIEDGLKLIEYTYLGGSGSRGSGKVRFVNEIDSNGKEIDPWVKIFSNQK